MKSEEKDNVIYPSAKGNKKSEKKGKKKKGKKSTPPPTPTKIEVHEDGVVGLFLATKTQEIFQCIGDEHVTEEKPLKLIKKEDVINDMKMRAAISDFHPVKQIVLDYPEEELIVVYDPAFKYGQNFYLCVTEESKKRATSEPEDNRAMSRAETSEALEERIFEYKPPIPKDWIDLGSTVDIVEEVVSDTRPKIRYLVSRLRSDFEGPCYLDDRDADPWSSDTGLTTSYVSCQSYKDKNFSLERMQQDSCAQAVPLTADGFSQTTWRYPVNASVQYEPRMLSSEEVDGIEKSDDYIEFIKAVLPRFELASQQNIILNVFINDWLALGEEDSNLGSKMDNHLKEYQSFTDLIYSKNKTVSCIDWHPLIKGVMAVACCERLTADERIEHSNLQMAASSMILVWSFSDPINPQLLLESPDDIMCFKFCPTNPNYVTGGCINGQLVLWDISAYEMKLINAKSGGGGLQQKKAAMFGEEVAPDTPTVRYAAVSSIEHGHKSMISWVEWVPDHFEFSRLGVPVENKNRESCQIVSCSTDSSVMVWDIRPSKMPTQPPSSGNNQIDRRKSSLIPFLAPSTFSHLDLIWRPIHKLNLFKHDVTGEYSPLNFTMWERQGFREHIDLESKVQVGEKSREKNLKVLESIKSEYFIGTEDGEVVCFDFKLEKEPETGKHQSPRSSWCAVAHGGPVHTLQRNPFFQDVLLSIGGWNFSLWREGYLETPILQSACRDRFYSGGHWSLSRPGVFFLSTRDGNVEVWDVLDRTNEPILVQNVTTAQITDIVPCIISKKQHLLAVSDNIGTLHILEIAWSLRSPSPNETLGMEKYLERESKRIKFFELRKPMWLEYKETKEKAKAQRRKTMASKLYVSENAEESEVYKEAYENYLKLEVKLLAELGLNAEGGEMEQQPL